VPKKGFDLLLDAFARIAPDHPDVGLVIGGVGPARDDLMRRATAVGLANRVSFPGVMTRGEIAWAMSAKDVFVLPSRVEPFGIVVLEALRAGCPVIVSARGGAPEIVRDGIDGLVIDPIQTEALSTSVARILTDRRLAQRLGASGHARAAEFDWHSITTRYRDLTSIRSTVIDALDAPPRPELRTRILDRYTWRHTAVATAAAYRDLVARCL
jgi:glycogen(starch) synthase